MPVSKGEGGEGEPIERDITFLAIRTVGLRREMFAIRLRRVSMERGMRA